ncbi:GMP synthase, partial [Aphelenchoides avenae]
IGNTEKNIYGVQFHPEVDLTENGQKMIVNFLRKIAGIKGNYTMHNREHLCIREIQETVGDKNVLVMVSGGVDSTVCAALLNKALGPERVVAIHIDNGFMRLHESTNVIKSLEAVGLKVQRFNCVDEFLNARYTYGEIETPPLRKVVQPEQKRMIIGDTFIRCKDQIMEKLGLNTDMFFAQGTLRPDLIESASSLASSHAEIIKTHHNDTALVRELRSLGKVIEPLKDFHKDEVRELGRTLGLPESIVNRHPFPGPGLAIRILCAEEPFMEEHYHATQRQLTEVMMELAPNVEIDKVIHCHLLPVKTVGVQ